MHQSILIENACALAGSGETGANGDDTTGLAGGSTGAVHTAAGGPPAEVTTTPQLVSCANSLEVSTLSDNLKKKDDDFWNKTKAIM